MLVLDFNTIDYVLLGTLGLLFLVQLYFYARYMAAPARKLRKQAPSLEERGGERFLPPVSVILCAHNESYNLSQYLQALLTQDWPEYEVIVVDDGSEDETRAIVESYMVNDERLRMTFVPYGARVNSTKKLALTLAAKAAKYDYLLLTDADCIPESPHWIAQMVKGFQMSNDKSQMSNDKCQISNVKSQFSILNSQFLNDIVLGFSPYFYEKGLLNKLIRFDTLFNGLHYLGAALCGHPYMGVGRNLAYRKAFFFESGGFTHLMTSRAGDDDLFVNHTATAANTAVVLSPESYTWSIPKRTMKEWWQQKRRHLSVSPAYRRETKFRLALEPLTRGLFYATVLGAIIYYLYSLPCGEGQGGVFVLLLALLLFLLRWIMQTIVINISARRMGQKRFGMFSILTFDILLPLISLWMLVVPKRNKKW